MCHKLHIQGDLCILIKPVSPRAATCSLVFWCLVHTQTVWVQLPPAIMQCDGRNFANLEKYISGLPSIALYASKSSLKFPSKSLFC